MVMITWMGDMGRLCRTAVLSVGLLSMHPGTAAAEIPTFDSVVYCGRLRHEVAIADPKVGAHCVSVEEYARSELEEFWPRADPETRTLCRNAVGGKESYAELAVCILGRIREISQSP